MSSTLLNEQYHCSNASLGLSNPSNVFQGTRSKSDKNIVNRDVFGRAKNKSYDQEP